MKQLRSRMHSHKASVLNCVQQLYEYVFTQKAWLSLIVVTALIAACGVLMTQLRLDASADALLLEDDQELRYYRTITARYGADDFLLVTYTPQQELFTDQSLSRLQALRDDLAALDGVKHVLTILEVPLFNSPPIALSEIAQLRRNLLSADMDYRLAKKELSNSPIYQKLLLSEDGRTTALLIFLQTDEYYESLLHERERLHNLAWQQQLSQAEQQQLEQTSKALRAYKPQYNARSQQLVQGVRDTIAQHRQQAEMFLGGISMIITDMIEYIRDDMRTFGSSLLIFFLLTLSVIFARPRWVFIPILCCLTAVVISSGLLALLDWHVTVVSANFVPLLLVITMSIVIHLCVYYLDHRRTMPALHRRQSICATTRFMYKPCLYSILTSMVAFFSLLVSGLRPVIDFGHIMSLGIAVGFVMCFTLFPTLLTILPAERSMVGKPSLTKKITMGCAGLVKKYHRLILWLAAGLAVISLSGAMRLEVENRFIDYFRSDTEIHQGMLVIDRQLGGTTPMDLILNAPQTYTAEPVHDEEDLLADYLSLADVEQTASNYWLHPSRFDKIKKLHAYLESQTEIGKVMSLSPLIEVLEQINRGPIGDLQAVFLRKLMPEDVRPVLLDPYLSEDGNQLRINMRIIDSNQELQRDNLIKRLNRAMHEDFGYAQEDYRISGLMVLYNNTLHSLYESQILTLGSVFLVIMLMFVFLFRSLLLAVIAIIPNALAAGIVLGTMGWSRIPLDIMTITIAAITIGIAVDNTIHYIIRFRREFAKVASYSQAIDLCHGSIGKAMYYTSSIIVIGFAILSLSNFMPTVYFGLLTALAMLSALLAALTLLPSLLLLIKPLGNETRP